MYHWVREANSNNYDLAGNMQSGAHTDVIVMDFSKVFDKVSQTLLTHKLHRYGICGETNAWITTFLNKRKQRVLVEGESSSEAEVTSGVPQGCPRTMSISVLY